jgi:hypothetical protein
MVNPRPKSRTGRREDGLKVGTGKRPKQITVTVTKTTQVPQFEPLVITVSQDYDIDDDDVVSAVRAEALTQIGKAVHKAIVEQTPLYLKEIGAPRNRRDED